MVPPSFEKDVPTIEFGVTLPIGGGDAKLAAIAATAPAAASITAPATNAVEAARLELSPRSGVGTNRFFKLLTASQ